MIIFGERSQPQLASECQMAKMKIGCLISKFAQLFSIDVH